MEASKRRNVYPESYWDWLPKEIQCEIIRMKNAHEMCDIFKESWWYGWKARYEPCGKSYKSLNGDYEDYIRMSCNREIVNLFVEREVNKHNEVYNVYRRYRLIRI